MEAPTLSALGKSGVKANRDLETFEAPKGLDTVNCTTDEFTSVCPITGQPDYTTISVEYSPRDRCLESKSLKLYWQSFREEGSFVEQLAVTMATDFYKALEPNWVQVVCVQKPRGGVEITSTCMLPKDSN